MTELTVFLIPFVIGSMAGAVATLFMTGARRQDTRDDEAIALGLMAAASPIRSAAMAEKR